MNFVGTSTTRYEARDNQRWLVGKLVRFYKIYSRLSAIGLRVAALDARKHKN